MNNLENKSLTFRQWLMFHHYVRDGEYGTKENGSWVFKYEQTTSDRQLASPLYELIGE